ncbi:hypothetical protein H072_7118 [Dactylellina haptotyla CBS 200.50]|uniref:SET domain-containing protein n=1 Tax=Dactylellina haptotyla (strain CBS 200.50) TaxID=1284197 RepID=S8ADB7_DACHA|nr:hypothetical protein H072_7118 [Dactylellina haptotyla CBS 200.50]
MDTTIVTPNGAPISSRFHIKTTPTAGRAVFATNPIPKGTPLVTAEDCLAPVILRIYRKEVCGWCYAYNLGRPMPFRAPDIGFAFCSTECEAKFRSDAGDIGVQAWTAVELLTRKSTRRVERIENDILTDIDAPRPNPCEIQAAWLKAELHGEAIRLARLATTDATKPPKAIRKAFSTPPAVDILPFFLSVLLSAHHHPDTTTAHISALASTQTPYPHASDLRADTTSYLHLLSILPLPLLPLLTPTLCLNLTSQNAHNSFGIRSSHIAPFQSPLSADPDGDEFFGYGTWPSASYFNHSCAPNLEKKRVGRVWYFSAGRAIESHEELCISYLGGEERSWSLDRRKDWLSRNWGFECTCQKCSAQEAKNGLYPSETIQQA